MGDIHIIIIFMNIITFTVIVNYIQYYAVKINQGHIVIFKKVLLNSSDTWTFYYLATIITLQVQYSFSKI